MEHGKQEPVTISGQEPSRVKFGAMLAGMQALLAHWLCTAFLASLLCACSPPRLIPDERPPVPVAVWTYLDLATSSTERSAFFQFATKQPIREVYLEASGLIARSRGPLADLLQEAWDHGIPVSLVLGRAAWVQPERFEEALAQVREVRDFAQSLRAAGRVMPRSLHLDVEPHTLPAWGHDWSRLGSQYLDLLAKVKQELGTYLPLAIAIPVWWDKRMITRQGRVLPLSRWAIEQADQTILMDYRNRPSAILSSAEAELASAEAINRQVVIGLAVHCSSDPENASISFCQKGNEALIQAMREVETRMQRRQGYGGLAVFSYEDWRVLKP